jgi:hypothetical protein
MDFIGYGIRGFVSGIDLASRLYELKWRKQQQEKLEKAQEEIKQVLLDLAGGLDNYFSTPITTELSLGNLELKYGAQPEQEVPLLYSSVTQQQAEHPLLNNEKFFKAVATLAALRTGLENEFIRWRMAIEQGQRDEAKWREQYVNELNEFLANLAQQHPEIIVEMDLEGLKKILPPESHTYIDIAKNLPKGAVERKQILSAARSPEGLASASKLFPEYGLPETADFKSQLLSTLKNLHEEGKLSSEEYFRALGAMAGVRTEEGIDVAIEKLQKALGRPLTEPEILRLAGITQPLPAPGEERSASSQQAIKDRWIVDRLIRNAVEIFDPENPAANVRSFEVMTQGISSDMKRFAAEYLANSGYLPTEYVRRLYGVPEEPESEPEITQEPPAQEEKSWWQRAKEGLATFFARKKKPDVGKMTNAELFALASNPPDEESGRAAYEELKRRGLIR